MNTKNRQLLLIGAYLLINCNALSLESRRAVLGAIGSACAGCVASSAYADTDVDNYLRSGMVSMPMGVSGEFEACCFVGLSSLLVKPKFQLHLIGQAGKAKPQTGVLLRYVNRPYFDVN
jgi:hypothetical protein